MWFGPRFSNWVDAGNWPLMFPKHLGPNWPINSCVMAKSSPLRGFWGVPFCLFWQLISARMPGLCARDQNFWANGGPTIHPKHPWENSPYLWHWCFKLDYCKSMAFSKTLIAQLQPRRKACSCFLLLNYDLCAWQTRYHLQLIQNNEFGVRHFSIKIPFAEKL